MSLTRRGFLSGVAGAPFVGLAQAQLAPRITVTSRVLDVKGKAAKVFGLMGPTGKPGLEMVLGQRFRYDLVNQLSEETSVHWHGLTPPSAMDGVPQLSAPALQPKETRTIDFENTKAGTHWMHSHVGLQEQRLLAAPLIVHELQKPLFDEQEHVVMLHDFSFRDPQEILADLKANMKDMPDMVMANDVTYDAMLANDRTLDDPEIVQAEIGGHLRLRIINGCSSTNMWIELGALDGSLIAVDGNTVFPVIGKRFPIGIAQRVDIRIALPQGPGAWPILFQAEGAPLRSGIIIKAGKAEVVAVSDQGEPGAMLDFSLEKQLRSVAQVPQEPTNQTEVVDLTGSDKNYSWGFNGKAMMHDTLFSVREGERVEVTMQNRTGMAHPMHLHGHYFKVVGLGDTRVNGAVRDTILIPAKSRATIQFDAKNPGNWAFHCHHLYHMNAGMMAAMRYVGAA
ncbi:MAG: multicopper oxidase family protein [Alphaproteobacteria bacterium]|nr:multicopper oxidase family protein [Alphaproteobacteria bacterium]